MTEQRQSTEVLELDLENCKNKAQIDGSVITFRESNLNEELMMSQAMDDVEEAISYPHEVLECFSEDRKIQGASKVDKTNNQSPKKQYNVADKKSKSYNRDT